MRVELPLLAAIGMPRRRLDRFDLRQRARKMSDRNRELAGCAAMVGFGSPVCSWRGERDSSISDIGHSSSPSPTCTNSARAEQSQWGSKLTREALPVQSNVEREFVAAC